MRKMKDSGIKWIGEIPADWNVIRCKYISSFLNGYAFDSKNLQKNFMFPVIRIGDIKSGGIDNVNCYGVNNNCGIENYLIKENDILLAMSGATVGKVGIAHNIENTYINQRVGIIRTNFPSYVFYCLSTKDFIEYILLCANGSAQPNVSARVYGEFSIPFPSKEIRMKISDFLNEKCSKIDSLAADIRKEIDVLEEYKKSVITEAVTKGLDTDADVIESSIYYMSPYNSKWRLSKIGYECTKLFRDFTEEDIPLICSNKGKVLQRPIEMSGKMVSEDNAMQGIRKGDIAIHGMDTWHGAIAISDYDGKITRVVHVCDSVNDKRFIVYYMQQLAFNGVYKLISNGVRGNTSDFRSWDKVKNIGIALPDVETQSKIADYLDIICRHIENIIIEKKIQLTNLEEYKKSIIYEYVTGKKEVQ